jgi:hypothetical protein
LLYLFNKVNKLYNLNKNVNDSSYKFHKDSQISYYFYNILKILTEREAAGMYKMQLVNVLNEEVLIEYSYSDVNLIAKFIDYCKETKGTECFIFDQYQQIYSSHYISYEIIRNEMEKIYQVFFKAKIGQLS